LRLIEIERQIPVIDTLDFLLEFRNLENLTIKNIGSYNLYDLRGLSNCTKLKILEFSLYFDREQEESLRYKGDFSLNGIENCIDLEIVSLSRIPIMDTKALTGLKNIRSFAIQNSDITHIHLPESSPKLNSITIVDCKKLNFVSVGTSSSHFELRCSRTNLKELPIPITANTITYSHIDSNPSLSSLDAFVNVKTVNDNKLEIRDSKNLIDINGVSNILNLYLTLDIHNLPKKIMRNNIVVLCLNDVQSLEGIGQFNKLIRLKLEKTSSELSLDALKELKSLEALDFEDNENLRSLKGISTLKNLKVLNLKNTPNLSDISDLTNMMIETIFTRGSKMKKADFPEHLQKNVIWN
jgi:hypothetical protein